MRVVRPVNNLFGHQSLTSRATLRRAMTGIPSYAKNFPDSTVLPSTYFHWPGVTHESTQVTRRVLEENDRKHDIYEKLRFAHNHFPHSILTRYALGAPPKLLEDTWKHDEPHLASLDPEDDHRETGDLGRLPDKITRENWDDPKTLGFKDAYSRYLVFFHEEVERLGPLGAVQEYMLSPQANWESRNGHPPPQMMVHMVAGVLHPIIHTGFGLEFRDVVVLAEGLAEAAIHDHGIMTKLFPSNWPKDELAPQSASPSEVKLDKWGQALPAVNVTNGKSLLEVYADFANDTELVPPAYDPDMMINDRLIAGLTDGRAEKLVNLVSEWSLTDEELADGPLGWEKQLQEVGVLVTLLACATGRKGQSPRIDFFMMHTLTSSIFLPAFMAPLDAPARRAILRTYILAVLSTTISRGKPAIDVDYLMSAPLIVVGPGTTPKEGSSRDCLSDPCDTATRNPWTSIIESSLYATDSHVPKSIRPLLHYSSTMGATPAGQFGKTAEGKEVLPGFDKLDGTMFARAAGLVMDVMGWCREGERAGSWEMSPIGYGEVWR